MSMGLLQDVERFWQMLLLDNYFVLFVITKKLHGGNTSGQRPST
jgi:hypothetical protein